MLLVLCIGQKQQTKVPHAHSSSNQCDTPYTLKFTLLNLQFANGSHIETYGTKILTINIGMQYDFKWLVI